MLNRNDITISVNDYGYIWVVLPDRILPENDYKVEQVIKEKLKGRNDHLVIDLKETPYIYSVLISIISRLLKKVVSGGGELYIVNASDRCIELLCLLKLDSIIPIFSQTGELANSLHHHSNRNILSQEEQERIQAYIVTGEINKSTS